MDKIKNKLIKMFIESDFDEAEFFEVSKDNSISLEEYYELMKDEDYKFQKMAQFEIQSIKIKCPWVNNVWFESMQNKKTGEFFLSSIHVFSKEDEEIISSFGDKDGKFDFSTNYPKIFLISPNIRRNLKRRNDLQLCTEELKEIGEIGKYIYNNKLHDKESISDNFKAIYRPDGGLYLFSDHDLVTCFLKPAVKNYDKPITKENDVRVLKKILLKNN